MSSRWRPNSHKLAKTDLRRVKFVSDGKFGRAWGYVGLIKDVLADNVAPSSVRLAARSQLPGLQDFISVWHPSNITCRPDFDHPNVSL